MPVATPPASAPPPPPVSRSRAVTLRAYQATDETATIALWHEAWQQAYPEIDFAARLPWWRTRWRDELVPNARVVVAETDQTIIGFVTIDHAGYLDQLVVAPAEWGSTTAAALVAEAKRLSPRQVFLLVNADNARAIRFYQRSGFVHDGDDVNPTSGRKVWRMVWTPE